MENIGFWWRLSLFLQFHLLLFHYFLNLEVEIHLYYAIRELGTRYDFTLLEAFIQVAATVIGATAAASTTLLVMVTLLVTKEFFHILKCVGSFMEVFMHNLITSMDQRIGSSSEPSQPVCVFVHFHV